MSDPTFEKPQAELFAELVANLLAPVREDQKATRHAAEGCFAAVLRIEQELARVRLEIDKTNGRVAALEENCADCKRRIAALEELLQKAG